MKKISKHTLGRALVCGFMLTVAASLFQFSASCATLENSVVRLHVIANSDSREDQEVKLKVRDAVLTEAQKWYGGTEDFQEANLEICTHLQSIRQAAQQALRENGFPETASAEVTTAGFPTRVYGAYCLPAGEYRTLRITIGEGKGKNWWCIVFPALCLSSAREQQELLAAMPEPGREVAEHPEKYEIKLKSVELLEQLKNWLSGK